MTQRTVVDGVRLAFQALLERPDEASLRSGPPFSVFARAAVFIGFTPADGGQPRGHHLTQPGKPERFVELWLPAVDAWTAERIAQSVGPVEGWKFQWRRHAVITPKVPQWGLR